MEFEDIQEEIQGKRVEQKQWGSEEIKLLVVFVGILLLVVGYMCYRNYVLISSGQMETMIRESRKKKKNKGKWDMDDI